MNHAVTVGDIVHWSLLALSIISLGGTAWFWLWLFAMSMSDSPQSGGEGLTWMIVAHVLPIAFFVAWWVT